MDNEILTMEEAAELLRVSIKTFIKLLKEEKVPARKIGREWRFSRKALVEWLSSGDSQAYSASEGETREFFNEVAPEWEEISKSYYDESIKNKLVELQILKKDLTIMDLGAGDGYISRGVAGLVKKVIAVDISAEMLKELKKKAKETGIKNIDTIESDAREVPLGSSSVDVLCASMYLHHIEQPEAAVREMHRLVRHGGIVFLADFLEHANVDLKEKMHDIWPGFKPDAVKEWFEKCGFGNVSIEILPGKGGNKVGQNNGEPGIFVMTAYR